MLCCILLVAYFIQTFYYCTSYSWSKLLFKVALSPRECNYSGLITNTFKQHTVDWHQDPHTLISFMVDDICLMFDSCNNHPYGPVYGMTHAPKQQHKLTKAHKVCQRMKMHRALVQEQIAFDQAMSVYKRLKRLSRCERDKDGYVKLGC